MLIILLIVELFAGFVIGGTYLYLRFKAPITPITPVANVTTHKPINYNPQRPTKKQDNQSNKTTNLSSPPSQILYETANTKEVLGWIPYWDQQAAFSSFKKNVDVFDFTSIFWYVLRSNGTIKKYPYAVEDPSIIKFAHSKNVKVLALIANLPAEDEGGNWDSERVDKVIKTSTARQKHIADLVALTKRLGFDGINIDYEALRADQKSNFSLFIKELATALHKNNKLLAVALHPKLEENNPQYSNGSEAQDWKELGKYADQLHLMTYEEHWETSEPGPIASVPWVSLILNYARSVIPGNKLFVGVPMYGYDWNSSGIANGLTYQDVLTLIKKYKPKISWDSNSQSNHFTYKAGSITHTVWYEDNASFKAKLDLFKHLGTTNLAFWRLGHEDTRVWTTVRNSF